MSASYRCGHNTNCANPKCHKRWYANARVRETRTSVYLGAFDTETEARSAIRAWYLRKYGNYHEAKGQRGPHRQLSLPL